MSDLLRPRPRTAGPERPVDLLAACHERIRAHLGIARALVAASPDAEPAAIANSAAAVERYFRLALPLHAADEDRTIAPLVRGRDASVDAALDTVARDHVAHAPDVEALVAITAALVSTPEALDGRREALRACVERLAPELEAHLALEEEVLFPALGTLSPREGALAVAEMRARRA